LNKQEKQNAKMPPKKKMKPIAAQETVASVFSAPSTSALLPDFDQPPESTSTSLITTSASSTELDEPTEKEVPPPSTSSSQKSELSSRSCSPYINGFAFLMTISCTVKFA